jgi:PKD repeat protein
LGILTVSPNCSVNSLQVICTDTSLAPNQSRQFTIQVQSVSLSNNDIVTNSVTYLAGNQTETLPEATTLPIEVIATNTEAGADFSGSPTSVGIGANVVFTNLSSGSGITSCLWEFGDTTTSTAACQPGNTVNHAYYQPGTYTVKLTVTTGSGPNTRTRVNYITVSGVATYGVQITSPQPAKSGARGTQVIYTVVITNTGTVPDSFTLSLPAAGTYQWVTQLDATALGPLAPQQSANAQVTILIPTAAPLIASDVVTITATSNSSTSATNGVALKTSTLVSWIYLPFIRR